MIDSQVDAISFIVVEETIWPSSTKIAELDDTLSTVAAIVPSLVEILSESPTSRNPDNSLAEFVGLIQIQMTQMERAKRQN